MSTRHKIPPHEIVEHWSYDMVQEAYYYLRLHDLTHPPAGGA